MEELEQPLADADLRAAASRLAAIAASRIASRSLDRRRVDIGLAAAAPIVFSLSLDREGLQHADLPRPAVVP